MILVDASVWIDHFRGVDAGMVELLKRGQVLPHPFVLGELSFGQLAGRNDILTPSGRLPRIGAAADVLAADG